MSTKRGYRFPGMDPWLEHPATWPDVHHRLITYIADELAGQIAPRYSARHGERLIIETSGRAIAPDVFETERALGQPLPAATATLELPVIIRLPQVWIRQPYVEIRDRRAGNQVITVIEILSPSNKRRGADARDKYVQKQGELLDSKVSLVEIDLLRGGEHTVAVPAECLADLGRFHYRIVSRRADRSAEAEVYPIRLIQRLPRLRVPLVAPDDDAGVDLQSLLERAYQAGGYAEDMDYEASPLPALEEADLAWAREVLGGGATAAGISPG
ncbi:MAG: DUF4058 family protein [Planctomycetes bacterium]|nr:DUF4058 family protein [Planctomycetota bacterium]